MALNHDRLDQHAEKPELHSSAPASITDKSTPREHRTYRRIWNTSLRLLSYTPQRCRYDPSQPPRFSLSLNLLFGFASTFTVANLYYAHPILNKLAEDFHVTNERSSIIPTVSQAGYATGLFFLCPLGDLLPRRPFVILLVIVTALLWLGLCITESFEVFSALSYITCVTTVTPQLMLPLVGDLSPPNRRAAALSIVVSGLLLGILIARLLSGVVTEYTSWRNIYWLALGLQGLIAILLWFFLPSYPSKNNFESGWRFLRSYAKLLWSILVILFEDPLLVQTCLIGFCASSTFTNYWTTLTFLLSGPPYHYNSLIIGLFALVGMGGLCLGPPYSRLVIDRFRFHFSVMIGLLVILTGLFIGTFLGNTTVAGPILEAFLLDFGLQSSQIANRAAIYARRPEARNRTNTAFMLSVFCGQIAGTSIGNAVYARRGWRGAGAVSLGFIGLAIVIWLMRAPNEERWVGWKGGWSIYKKKEVLDEFPAGSKESEGVFPRATKGDA